MALSTILQALNSVESWVEEKIDLDNKTTSQASHWVKQRTDGMTIVCKTWKVRNGQFFDKNAFVLDWDNHLIRCPNGVSLPFTEGTVVRFPKHECEACSLRSQCTQSKQGRSISIHADESLLAELRERQITENGRAKLRERVSLEHTLAHIGQWQGDKARYIGLRNNLFDLRRMAIVHNLHVLARMLQTTIGEITNLAATRSS